MHQSPNCSAKSFDKKTFSWRKTWWSGIKRLNRKSENFVWNLSALYGMRVSVSGGWFGWVFVWQLAIDNVWPGHGTSGTPGPAPPHAPEHCASQCARTPDQWRLLASSAPAHAPEHQIKLSHMNWSVVTDHWLLCHSAKTTDEAKTFSMATTYQLLTQTPPRHCMQCSVVCTKCMYQDTRSSQTIYDQQWCETLCQHRYVPHQNKMGKRNRSEIIIGLCVTEMSSGTVLL